MKRISEYISDYTVFDLETTGLSTEYDEIVEVGAIKVRNHKMISSFSSLVRPNRPIPIEASECNHIFTDMVKNSPNIATVLGDFVEFVGDDIVLGHNIEAFDLKLVRRECINCFGRDFVNDYVDSLIIAKTKLPHLGSRSLCSLAKYYNVSYEGAHRALQDCGINQVIYEDMFNVLIPDSETKVINCPICKSGTMVIRFGKFGKFRGCSNYPNCRNTMQI